MVTPYLDTVFSVTMAAFQAWPKGGFYHKSALRWPVWRQKALVARFFVKNNYVPDLYVKCIQYALFGK
jgi:hypothetical protein